MPKELEEKKKKMAKKMRKTDDGTENDVSKDKYLDARVRRAERKEDKSKFREGAVRKDERWEEVEERKQYKKEKGVKI